MMRKKLVKLLVQVIAIVVIVGSMSYADNPIIQMAAKQDFPSFYTSEMDSRKYFGYPPFSSMVKLVFSSESPEAAKDFAEQFKNKLIELLPSQTKIHPVVESGRPKIKDKHRFQFLIRGKNIPEISEKIALVKASLKKPHSVNLFIDIDPINTFF